MVQMATSTVLLHTARRTVPLMAISPMLQNAHEVLQIKTQMILLQHTISSSRSFHIVLHPVAMTAFASLHLCKEKNLLD
ncbi:hypothetical protein ACET3Z_011528 [Daucus carota]